MVKRGEYSAANRKIKNTMKRNIMRFILALVLGLLLSKAGVTAQETNSKPSAPASGAPKSAQARKVGVDEFERLWLAKTNVVLDVRTEKEYGAGHIPRAINIDVNGPDFGKKIADLDRKKTYLVHCAAGVRSARACQKMETLGFENLIDLSPGFRGWRDAGKPIEK